MEPKTDARYIAHRTVEWVWTHVTGTALLISLCALALTLYTHHVSNEADSNQHNVNTVVYQACLSDTEAEKNANVIVGQLRGVIERQIVLLKVTHQDKLVPVDEKLLKSLPVFPPLPPCGAKP